MTTTGASPGWRSALHRAAESMFPDGLHPVRLQRVGTSARVLLATGLVLVAGLALLALTGWRGPQELSPVLGYPYFPALLPLTALAGGVASALLALVARSARTPARVTMAAGAVAVSLWVQDSVARWPFGTVVVLAGVTLVTLAFVPAPWLDRFGLRYGLLAVPFVVAAVAGATGDGTEIDLAALRAMQAGTVSALVVAALAAFALVTALHTRHQRVARAIEGRAPPWLLAAVLALKSAALLALYLRLTGDWLGGEPYWRPRLNQPLSWLHAALVATVILVVAVRSWARPLAGAGFTRWAAILAAGAGFGYLVAALAGVIATAGSALRPDADVSGVLAMASQVIDGQEVVQVGVAAGLLVLGVYGLIRRRAWTSGVVLQLLGGLWLLPPLVGIAIPEQPVTFWATPGQVDTMLTIGVALYVVRAGLVGTLRQDTTLLVRLLVIPTIVVNGDRLLPESWTAPLLTVAIVMSTVVALALDAPPVSPDRRRNERTLGLLVAGQVALLTAYLYLLPDAELTGQLDTAARGAWLWLAVPAAGVLAARAVRQPDPPGSGSQPAPVPDPA